MVRMAMRHVVRLPAVPPMATAWEIRTLVAMRLAPVTCLRQASRRHRSHPRGGPMYHCPDEDPRAIRPICNVLVRFVGFAGHLDRRAAWIIYWTGDPTAACNIARTARWSRNVSVSLCVWCGKFHWDCAATGIFISQRYPNPPLGPPAEIEYQWLRLYSQCLPCITFTTSPRSIDRESERFCRRCRSWVRTCEHLLFFDFV